MLEAIKFATFQCLLTYCCGTALVTRSGFQFWELEVGRAEDSNLTLTTDNHTKQLFTVQPTSLRLNDWYNRASGAHSSIVFCWDVANCLVPTCRYTQLYLTYLNLLTHCVLPMAALSTLNISIYREVGFENMIPFSCTAQPNVPYFRTESTSLTSSPQK